MAILSCSCAALFLIRSLAFVGILSSSFLLWSISMDPLQASSDPGQLGEKPKFWFAILGLPAEDAAGRMKKVSDGLRAEFGGPEIEPHVTVVGLTMLTEEDAVNRFRSAVDGMRVYAAKVDRVATGSSYYQCVYLLLQPSPEVVKASVHCSSHFGYKSTTPYMPHISLLYGDLSDKETEAAKDKANVLDTCLSNWEFTVTRLVLQKVPRLDDKSTKSWQNVTEVELI